MIARPKGKMPSKATDDAWKFGHGRFQTRGEKAKLFGSAINKTKPAKKDDNKVEAGEVIRDVVHV